MGIKRAGIIEVSIGTGNGLCFSASSNTYFPLKVTFEPMTFKGGYRMIFEDSYSREDVELLRDTLTEMLETQPPKQD